MESIYCECRGDLIALNGLSPQHLVLENKSHPIASSFKTYLWLPMALQFQPNSYSTSKVLHDPSTTSIPSHLPPLSCALPPLGP